MSDKWEAPEKIMAWRSSFEMSWLGTWSTERWPDDAVSYVRADLPPTYAAALALPEIAALVEAATAIADEICDYMKINHLGDGEQKHNVKRVRATLAAIEAAKAPR